jgi:hypothetical protein
MIRRVLVALAIILGLAGFVALAFSLATNSRFSISGSSVQDGEATVETDLPNVTCRKILRLGWPPVRLECEEKEE